MSRRSGKVDNGDSPSLASHLNSFDEGLFEDLAAIINDASLIALRLPNDGDNVTPKNQHLSGRTHSDPSIADSSITSATGSNTRRKRAKSTMDQHPDVSLTEMMPVPAANMSVSRDSHGSSSRRLKQPEYVFEDISRRPGSRSSGLVDVYEIPPSPTRNTHPEVNRVSPPKRRRGRPGGLVPKKKLSRVATKQTEDPQILMPEIRQEDNSALASTRMATRSNTAPNTREPPVAAEMDDDDLLFPAQIQSASSPKEHVRQPKLRARPQNRIQKIPAHRAGSIDLDESSHPTEGDAEMQEGRPSSQASNMNHNQSRESGQEKRLVSSHREVFDEKQIEEMMKLVRDIVENSPEEMIAIDSHPIMQIIKRLLKDYERMQTLGAERGEDFEVQKSHQRKRLDLLESKLSTMLDNRLFNIKMKQHKSVESRQRVLADIYMHFSPGLVQALDTAFKLYREPTDSELGELMKIISLLRDILKPALRENKEVQPSGCVPPIVLPSRQLFPYVRVLLKQGTDELEARAAAARAEEYRKGAPERKRKREGMQHAEEEAVRRRRNEAIRNMNTSLSQSQARLGLPVYSPDQRRGMTQSIQLRHFRYDDDIDNPRLEFQERRALCETELERLADERRITDAQMRRLRTTGEINPGPSITEQLITLEKKMDKAATKLVAVKAKLRELRPEEDNAQQLLDRVHMFGENNIRLTREPKWTKEEMGVLIDGLREERGPDRYRNLLRTLDRSIDEIYEKALEFKMTVEDHYRRDRMSKPRAYHPPLEDWIESIGSIQT